MRVRPLRRAGASHLSQEEGSNSLRSRLALWPIGHGLTRSDGAMKKYRALNANPSPFCLIGNRPVVAIPVGRSLSCHHPPHHAAYARFVRPRLGMARLILFGFLLASLITLGGCSKSQTVYLATRTTLSPNHPLVLRAPRPLLLAGLSNELCLEVMPPDSVNFPAPNSEWGVRRRDGVLVKVGAALLRGDNTADTITADGYRLGVDPCLTIGPSIYDSLQPPFTGVRITTTDSVTVSRIIWHSWTGP